MLVLSRKLKESIVVGDSIVITVLAIDGENVKLGIAAPHDVRILRQEVFQAMRDQEKIQELMIEETNSDKYEPLRNLLADESDQDAKPEEDQDTQ